MIEGWHGEDYPVLFAESEIDPAGDRYEVSRQLPGLKLAGLWSRDDFVVQDPKGHTFSVPTVPFDQKYLEPYSVDKSQARSEFRGQDKVAPNTPGLRWRP